MELQRIPKNNLTSLEWHWCHQRNVKFFGVTKSIQDEARHSCVGSSAIPCSPCYKICGLSYFRQLQRFCIKSRRTPISAQKLVESSMKAISSREESGFPGFYWRSRPTFHKHLKSTLHSAVGMWEGPEFAASSRVDTEMPWLFRRSDFPAVSWMQARLSSHKKKWCMNHFWRI